MMIDKVQNLPADDAAEFVSPINFRLDVKSGVPTYLQLVHQVEHALRLGYLQLGDQLPRVKDVVGSLSINPNTVIKAYADLEGKGIAVGRPGRGTFIVAEPKTIGLAQLTTLRQSLLRGWLAEAGGAGLDENDIVALFTSTLQEFIAGTAGTTNPGKAKRAEEIA